MGISSWFRLFSECFKLAGVPGIIACFRFLTGDLKLDHFESKSSIFLVGGSDV